MINNRKRSIVLDLFKFILALLVVDLHIESFVSKTSFTPIYYLGWFAVPIFVTLTFYFLANKFFSKDVRTTSLIKKLNRYIFPFIFWSGVGFVLHPNLITLKYLFRQMFTGTAVDPPLYYLSTVTIVSILIYAARKLIVDNVKLIWVIMLALLVIESTGIETTIASHIPIQIQLASVRIFEFTKYGLLGLMVDQIYNHIFSKINKFILLLITSVLTNTYILWQWFYQVSELSYGGIIQFCLVIFIMMSVMSFRDLYFGYWLSKFAKYIAIYSLGIYCIHTFILERLHGTTNPILLTLFVFTLSLLISIVIDVLSRGRLKQMVA